MKIWLIVIQGDDTTWVEDAWDDMSTAENRQGWEAAVAKARDLAHDNGYEVRIAPIKVDGVYELFENPELKAALDT